MFEMVPAYVHICVITQTMVRFYVWWLIMDASYTHIFFLLGTSDVLYIKYE